MSKGIQDNYHRIKQSRIHTARIPWDCSASTDEHFPTVAGFDLAIVAARLVFTVAGDDSVAVNSIDIGTYLIATGLAADASGIVAAGPWSGLTASTVVGTLQTLTLASTLNNDDTEGLPLVLSTERIRATASVAGANTSEGFIEIDYFVKDTIDID